MEVIEQIADAVTGISGFFKINNGPTINMDFTDWADIQPGRGIYILYNDDEIIYVGRGNIKSRQESHYKKLTGALTEHDNKEPKGWKYLREQRGIDHTKLQLTVIYLTGKDDEAAMEGGLIKLLQPYTNDEIFSKNVQLGNL